MRDPLILPLAAILSGILLGRALAFSVFDALWPTAALVVLAIFAKGALRRCCVGLALVCIGAFSEA